MEGRAEVLSNQNFVVELPSFVFTISKPWETADRTCYCIITYLPVTSWKELLLILSSLPPPFPVFSLLLQFRGSSSGLMLCYLFLSLGLHYFCNEALLNKNCGMLLMQQAEAIARHGGRSRLVVLRQAQGSNFFSYICHCTLLTREVIRRLTST